MEHYDSNEIVTQYNWARAILELLSIDRGISPNERDALKKFLILGEELENVIHALKEDKCCIADGTLLVAKKNEDGEEVWTRLILKNVEEMILGEED